MKLIRLTVVLLFIFCFSNAMSQDKWRTLTISTINGTDFKGNYFNTLTSNFHWDLNKKYFLTNWTGFQVQHNGRGSANSWLASQSTLNRYAGNWMLGAGIQYGLVSNPGVFQINNRSAFAITSVSYRWKFGKK